MLVTLSLFTGAGAQTPTETQVSAKESAMAKLAKLGLTEYKIKALIR
jgi:hypothetical protein